MIQQNESVLAEPHLPKRPCFSIGVPDYSPPETFRVINSVHNVIQVLDLDEVYVLHAALRVAYRIVSCPRGERIVNALLSTTCGRGSKPERFLGRTPPVSGDRFIWWKVPVDRDVLEAQRHFSSSMADETEEMRVEVAVDPTTMPVVTVRQDQPRLVAVRADVLRAAGAAYTATPPLLADYDDYLFLLGVHIADGIVRSIQYQLQAKPIAPLVDPHPLELNANDRTGKHKGTGHHYKAMPSFTTCMSGVEIEARQYTSWVKRQSLRFYPRGKVGKREYWYYPARRLIPLLVQGDRDWDRFLPLLASHNDYVVIPGRPDTQLLHERPPTPEPNPEALQKQKLDDKVKEGEPREDHPGWRRIWPGTARSNVVRTEFRWSQRDVYSPYFDFNDDAYDDIFPPDFENDHLGVMLDPRAMKNLDDYVDYLEDLRDSRHERYTFAVPAPPPSPRVCYRKCAKGPFNPRELYDYPDG